MELWDAYTKNGEKTGGILVRGEPVPEGLYHLVCEVLVRHRDGSYLAMKRAEDKETFPGWYETTAGGSALRGETSLDCARRELLEETGIACDAFEFIGREVRTDCLFDSYVCAVDCDKAAVRLQEGETVGFLWMSETEFADFAASERMIPTQKRRLTPYLRRMGYID